MSADHEKANMICGKCGERGHITGDHYTGNLPEHPPAQVVEADCRHCQAGLPYVPFGQPSPGGNYHRIHSAAPAAPTDPARKPSLDDEVAGTRLWQKALGAFHAEPEGSQGYASDICTAALIAAREAGRQAGAEEMREVALKAACRFCAEYGTVVDIRGHRHIHCRPNGDWYECFGARIRSATIPEPRS